MPNVHRLLLTLCCAVMGSLAAHAQTVTATVMTGSIPAAVAVNPVTNKIYVANLSSDTVTVIDGATNSTTTVTSETRPRAKDWRSRTTTYYLTKQDCINVTEIDGTTNC